MQPQSKAQDVRDLPVWEGTRTKSGSGYHDRLRTMLGEAQDAFGFLGG